MSFLKAGVMVAVLLAAPMAAEAKVFPIPAEDPIATINLPDSWSPETYDGGVEVTSPDNGIYLAAEQVKGDDLQAAVEETVKTLVKQGLEIDTSTQKIKDIEINGLKAHDLSYTGKDKDGPAKFSITLVETKKPGNFLMLSYWGSDEGEQANAKALGEIGQSIQETK
jgi:hypothetical protein